jgi:hypothetical protein
MAGARFDCKTYATAALRRVHLAIGLVALVATPAFTFDFARYQAADLDDILAQRRPQTGLDLNGAKPLRLEVKLVSYGETCAVQTIPLAMTMLAFSKEQIDSVQATRCIKVRSAKGKEALLFIQDVVRAHLPGEVPLGGPVTLVCDPSLHGARGARTPGQRIRGPQSGHGGRQIEDEPALRMRHTGISSRRRLHLRQGRRPGSGDGRRRRGQGRTG